ncbi:MAG: hypothetical protein ACTHU0_15640 [Kofleriaceae bacterium]
MTYSTVSLSWIALALAVAALLLIAALSPGVVAQLAVRGVLLGGGIAAALALGTDHAST